MTSSPETTPTDTPLPACSSGRIPEHSPADALPAEGSRLPCRLSDGVYTSMGSPHVHPISGSSCGTFGYSYSL